MEVIILPLLVLLLLSIRKGDGVKLLFGAATGVESDVMLSGWPE